MNKPNCYECKFRGNLPGDAHSCCKHPSVKHITDDPIMGIARIFSMEEDEINFIKVKGSAHGIRNGWFFWPLNFDPVWLESCEGFEQK